MDIPTIKEDFIDHRKRELAARKQAESARLGRILWFWLLFLLGYPATMMFAFSALHKHSLGVPPFSYWECASLTSFATLGLFALGLWLKG